MLSETAELFNVTPNSFVKAESILQSITNLCLDIFAWSSLLPATKLPNREAMPLPGFP
jgi:hypothetical protein